MSDSKTFLQRVTEFVSKAEKTKNRLSKPIKDEIDETLKGIQEALKPLKETGGVKPELETSLNELLDQLFNIRRLKIIGILLDNKLTDFSLEDLEYIKSTLRLPEIFSLKLLKKLLTGDIDSNDIDIILNMVLDKKEGIDKDECINFIMKKLGVPENLIETFLIFWDGKSDDSSLERLLSIENRNVIEYIFEKIIKSSDLTLENILLIFKKAKTNKNLKGLLTLLFLFDENAKHRDKLFDDLENYIEEILNTENPIKTGFLGKLTFEEKSLKFRKFLTFSILNNDKISFPRKAEFISGLRNNIDDVIEFLDLKPEISPHLVSFLGGKREISGLSKFKIINSCPTKIGKQILFYIFFENFDVIDIERIARDGGKEMEKNGGNETHIERIKNRIYDSFQNILGIPNIRSISYKEPRKSGKKFGWGKQSDDIIDLNSENPIYLLLMSKKLGDKITTETEITTQIIHDLMKDIETYEGRKIIFELYFRGIKQYNVDYNEFLDLLFQKGFIRKSEILDDNKLKKFLHDYFGNDGIESIVDSKKIIEKMKFLIENCNFGGFFSIWFSDFIVNLLKNYSLEEIKEIIGELRIDEENPLDLISLAKIEGGIKQKKENEGKKPGEKRDLKDFLSINYDIASLKIIFEFFGFEFSQGDYKKMEKTLGFLKIRKLVRDGKGGTIDKNEGVKDFSKIRKNLKTLFAMFPQITLEDFEKQDIFDMLTNFDNEMFEFLRKENDVSNNPNTEEQSGIDSFIGKVLKQFESFFVGYNDKAQEIRVENRKREFTEICRNIKFSVTLDGLIKNKNSIYLTQPGKIDTFLIACYRHIFSGIRNGGRMNKFFNLRGGIRGLDQLGEFSVLDGINFIIEAGDIADISRDQAVIGESDIGFDKLVYNFIFNFNPMDITIK